MPKRYTPNDAWSQKAAAEGYRARSVYKLQQLDERLKLLKSGMSVLDFGAAPGSWLQYVSEKIGSKGKGIGIDLQEIDPIADNIHTYVADFTDEAALQKILEGEGLQGVDIVLSDAAPATSGIKDIDQWKSLELCCIVEVTAQHLLPGRGTCVMKAFRGADFDNFLATLKRRWKKVTVQHPPASRDRSMEVYVICSGPVLGKEAESVEI